MVTLNYSNLKSPNAAHVAQQSAIAMSVQRLYRAARRNLTLLTVSSERLSCLYFCKTLEEARNYAQSYERQGRGIYSIYSCDVKMARTKAFENEIEILEHANRPGADTHQKYATVVSLLRSEGFDSLKNLKYEEYAVFGDDQIAIVNVADLDR